MKSKYKTSSNNEKEKNSGLVALLASEGEDIKLKVEGSSHRFTDEVRKTFYSLQGEASVAAGNCSKVVETVARHLFKADISKEDLPSASTAINFANEAHVIAKHQAASEILKTDHFTYASDGTSRQKSHYLDQHIILSDGKQLSLGFSEIASDDSQTLLEKCVALFKDLCEIYCLDDECVDGNELLKDIIRKMKVLLSDRGTVNKAFNSKMLKYKEELLEGEDFDMHFIFCNAHFLLALSSAAESALLTVEKQTVDEGVKLGRDSLPKFSGFSSSSEGAAVRLIRTAAEVLGPRGDEKSGCRQEWLAFCSARSVTSTFCSFRSNRFNNLFQNATSVLRHRHDMSQFLNEYVSHSNMKLQSVVADLEDRRIITSISVLSFIHVCLTEPYWRLMNSSKSYADFSHYVKKMKSLFDTWRSNDFYPTRASVTSVFDDDEFKASASDICVAVEFISLSSFDKEAFKLCLYEIISHCDKALTRQLSDFLEEGLFGGDLADDVKSVLSTCPLTNLTGERLFGDLDYCLNKRRNATLILRSTTNMWKHNQTARWLSKQTPKKTQDLIERAIKYGPIWKKKSVEDRKDVREKVQARIAENKKKKDDKLLKAAERKSAALDAILAEGGNEFSERRKHYPVRE